MGDRQRRDQRMRGDSAPPPTRTEADSRKLLGRLDSLRLQTTQPQPPALLQERGTEERQRSTESTLPTTRRRTRQQRTQTVPIDNPPTQERSRIEPDISSTQIIPLSQPSVSQAQVPDSLQQQLQRSERELQQFRQEIQSQRGNQRSIPPALITTQGISLQTPAWLARRESRRRHPEYQTWEDINPGVESERRQIERALLQERLIPMQVRPPIPTQYWTAIGEALRVVEIVEVAQEVSDFSLRFVPIVGEAIDAIEASTGRNWITQEVLSDEERVMAATGVGLSVLIPVAGRVIGIARRGRSGLRLLSYVGRRVGRNRSEVLEFLQRVSRLQRPARVYEDALDLVRRRRSLTQEQYEALEELLNAFEPMGIGMPRSPSSVRAARRVISTTRDVERVFQPLRQAQRLIELNQRLNNLGSLEKLTELMRTIGDPTLTLVQRQTAAAELAAAIDLANTPGVRSVRMIPNPHGSHAPDFVVSYRQGPHQRIEVTSITQILVPFDDYRRSPIEVLSGRLISAITEKARRGQFTDALPYRVNQFGRLSLLISDVIGYNRQQVQQAFNIAIQELERTGQLRQWRHLRGIDIAQLENASEEALNSFVRGHGTPPLRSHIGSWHR